MLDQIFALLQGREVAPPDPGGESLRVCVAALLVEAARMDDRFDAAERSAIERVLAERFVLSAEETRKLVGAAELAVDSSTQLFRFTDSVVRGLDVADRARI